MSFTPETLLRHWQTLRLIPRHPRKVTAGDICEALAEAGFSVGKRTVERDLQALSRLFPLALDDREKPYGWCWAQDAVAFDVPGVGTNEALAFLMARTYLGSVIPTSVQNQLAPYFRMAEQRLDTLAGHSALASWLKKVKVIEPTLPLIAPVIPDAVEPIIHEALLLDRQCQISYLRKDASDPDQYLVNPLGLVQRGKVVYLVCTIKTYQDLRILALHRIQAAELLDSKALCPEGFDLNAYLATGAFGWGDGKPLKLTALFAPEAASHLYETPLSVDQRLSVQADGRVQVKATVADGKQLLWWLLGFGAAVEVVSPKALRGEVARQVLAASEKYK